MGADTPARWDARQRALLEAMGVVLWTPSAAPAAAAVDTPAAPPAEAVRPAAPPVAPVRPPVRPPQASVAAEPSAPGPAPIAAPRDHAMAVALPVRGERAERIAALDWPALRAAVADCQACGLHGGRTQTVFGVGEVPAHWMVVGEAPGEQEDRQGEPFVGPAGQLLDAMLRAIGLGRGASDPAHQAYIANTLKCRPPRNRNPAPDELLHCEPFLQRQIALVQPRIILAMGKFAIQQLTGSDEPVGRLRGRVHRYQGVPVVVTYHPAYLLRQPSEKAKAWDDLRLARRVYAQAISSAP